LTNSTNQFILIKTLSKGSPLPFEVKESGPVVPPSLGFYFFIIILGVVMAQKVKKKINRRTKKQVSSSSPFNIYWKKQNYYLLIMGFAIILIGFYLMSVGPWNSTSALVVSPILLVIGFVLIFPASIFYKTKNNSNNLQEDKIDSSQG